MNYEYEYWLQRITPLSGRKKVRLHRHCASGEAIYYIEEAQLQKLTFLTEQDIQSILKAQKEKDIAYQYQELEKKNIRFVPWNSPQYPGKLAVISDPPYALYVKGQLPDAHRYAAAIVGARRCTPYGESNALDYGKNLAAAGIQIISGLAYGIDGSGHRGALLGKGTTFAVLGCGVDICYPRENIGLYADILNQGGVLSEYPPGVPPLAAHFPQRNRIISALADITLVIEAKYQSGSLITADMALEQGKDVFALPGPVNSSFSQGCNQLIKQGAGVLLSPELLLEELNFEIKKFYKKSNKNKKMLESPENMVYSRLCLNPKSIHDLVAETSLPANKVVEYLVSLELQGYIREISKNHYVTI